MGPLARALAHSTLLGGAAADRQAKGRQPRARMIQMKYRYQCLVSTAACFCSFPNSLPHHQASTTVCLPASTPSTLGCLQELLVNPAQLSPSFTLAAAIARAYPKEYEERRREAVARAGRGKGKR